MGLNLIVVKLYVASVVKWNVQIVSDARVCKLLLLELFLYGLMFLMSVVVIFSSFLHIFYI